MLLPRASCGPRDSFSLGTTLLKIWASLGRREMNHRSILCITLMAWTCCLPCLSNAKQSVKDMPGGEAGPRSDSLRGRSEAKGMHSIGSRKMPCVTRVDGGFGQTYARQRSSRGAPRSKSGRLDGERRDGQSKDRVHYDGGGKRRRAAGMREGSELHRPRPDYPPCGPASAEESIQANFGVGMTGEGSAESATAIESTSLSSNDDESGPEPGTPFFDGVQHCHPTSLNDEGELNKAMDDIATWYKETDARWRKQVGSHIQKMGAAGDEDTGDDSTSSEVSECFPPFLVRDALHTISVKISGYHSRFDAFHFSSRMSEGMQRRALHSKSLK